MKRFIIFVGTVLLSLMLVACGGNDNNTETDNEMNNNTVDETREESDTNEDQMDDNNMEENNVDENNTDGAVNSDDMKQKMEKQGYKEFELEVEYADNQEYEAEIELENDTMKATLDDDLNDENLKGEEAFDKLFPLVKKLDIDHDTKKEDALDAVLNTFDLKDDYQKIELEITFNDDTELEYEDRK